MKAWGMKRTPTSTFDIERIWLVIGSRKEKTLWEVARQSIRELDVLPEGAWPIISLDDEDKRLVVGKKISNKRAKSFIRREYGQAPRIINRSANGVIYGRSIASLSMDYKVTPAFALIDALMTDRGWPEQRHVVGFMLSAEESHNVILALWGTNPNGDLTTCQLTENATQSNQIIQSYCKTHAVEESNVIIYGIHELFQAVNEYYDQLKAYPLVDDLFGIPKYSIWQGTATIAMVLMIASIAVCAGRWMHGRSLDSEQLNASRKTEAARQSVVEMFNRNLQRVADRASLNYNDAVDISRQVYAPGGLVSLSTTKEGTKIRFTLPINREGSSTGEVLAPDVTPAEHFIKAHQRIVQGFKPTVAIGAAGNEINYDYLITEDNRRLLTYIDR